jgi:phosphoribosyl-ATP pyrophosphohydrolase
MKPYKVSSFNFSQLPIEVRIDILKNKLKKEEKIKDHIRSQEKLNEEKNVEVPPYFSATLDKERNRKNIIALKNRIHKLQQKQNNEMRVIKYDKIYNIGDNCLAFGGKRKIDDVSLAYQAYRVGEFWYYFDGYSCGSYPLGVTFSRKNKLDPTISPVGYHNKAIEKSEYGTFKKIREEFLELEDATEQNNKILAINELSDLIGAIEGYANSLSISLDDLIQMKELTKRAFENGVRK